MMRSRYKLILNNPYSAVVFNPKIKKKFNILFNKKADKNPDFIFWNPNIFFSSNYLNKRVAVHSGNSFSFIQVRNSMIFNKVGSFVRTKRLGSTIHIIKRKKKK